MLAEPMLEFLRSNAPLEGNFSVGLPENYWEVEDALGSKRVGLDAEIALRDYLLNRVVRPLTDVSSSVRFYRTSFSESSFGGEGARLHKILRKVGRHYELVRGQDPINTFERFWKGVESDGSARGYVLFTLDDQLLDLRPIFALCYDPGVKSIRSWRSAWGAALYKTITDYVAGNHDATAILLEHAGSLSSLTVFPGRAVFSRRLEEAISSHCPVQRPIPDFPNRNF